MTSIEIWASASNIKKFTKSKISGIHVDWMDGKFVDTYHYDEDIIKWAKPLKVQVHLMVVNPRPYIERCLALDVDIIAIHSESYPNLILLSKDIELIHDVGRKCYIVFNPETPVTPLILSLVDGVIIMTVKPGRSGQSFMFEMLPKIKQLRAIYRGNIAVDGGINEETFPLVKEAGANIIISGSFLANADEPDKIITKWIQTI